MDAMTEIFGEPISVYTREDATEDGVLVDVTEWASADKGFHGGFVCPVAMTRKLWDAVDIDQRPHRTFQSTRGRAHDVLWMASLALRSGKQDVCFYCILSVGRTKKQILRAVLDGNGVTIGFREDEW